MSADARATPLRSAQALSWYWWLPLITIIVLICTVATFVWLGLRAEHEERHTALIGDSLWMEQNLRFHLENTENALSQLGTQLAVNPTELSEALEDKVRALLQGNSGLVNILWLDAEGNTVTTLPASSAPVMLASDHDVAIQRARALNRPTYSRPFVQADGSYAMEAIVPIFGTQNFTGYVVGTYSLSRLIEKHIPWWFAERYRFALTDSNGQDLAQTTNSSLPENTVEYHISLDQIGGLGIDVGSIPTAPHMIPNVTLVLLAGFALLIIWSMWSLRLHVLRLQATESALRREHAFRLAMENSALVGLYARDTEGMLTHVNTALCRLIGWNADELIGRAPPFPLWEQEDNAAAPAPAERGELQPTREAQFIRRDGIPLDVLLCEAPLVDTDGQQNGWVGSVLDITERKEAAALARLQQERLEATARLVSMGEMASSLAHEINQPLSAIASYSAGCLNTLRNGRYNEKQFLEILEKINQQAQRAGRIVHRIYGFVKRSESRCEAVDINPLIKEAVGILESDAQRRKVRIECRLAKNLPALEADHTLIEQVIINLMRNGMDAMKQTPEAERSLLIESQLLADKNAIRIAITDHGTGVPQHIADKLFDSFFTTKPEGMGMGLKICRSVAEQHKGRLWFEPAPHGGTSFFLQLPIEAGTATPAQAD